MRIEDALRLARESDLDLVEVAPQARPPKEMKLRPKIDDHDYETKKGHVLRFLKAGDKVKITIMFRGREQSRPELGVNLLRRLAEDVAEYATVESAPKQDGRNMLMVLAPTKRKTEARADAEAEKQRKAAERAADADAERAEQAESRAASADKPVRKRKTLDLDPNQI